MKVLLFFFLPLLLIPHFAYAQSNEQVNFDKCEYDIISQNVYSPFYFHVNHEPAISQKFIWNSDHPNLTPFTRSPGGETKAEDVTWYEFGSDLNATAIYEFELDLGYLEKSELPRPITIQLYSTNGLMMDKKIFQEEKIGCIAFRVAATPPPHQFTSEEILQIAKLEFAGITKQYTDSVNHNTEESNGLKIQLIVSNIVIFGIIGFLILNDRMRKKALDDLKSEYEIRNNILSTSIMKLDASVLMNDLNKAELKANTDSMISTIINNFGHIYKQMQDAIKNNESKVNDFINELRSELDLAEKQISKVPHTVTFVDAEEHVTGDDDISRPKSLHDQIEDNKCPVCGEKFGFTQDWNVHIIKNHPDFKSKFPTKSEEVTLDTELVEELYEDVKIGKIFPFNFDILETIKKPFVRKQEPQLSDIEKLRLEWNAMSNEKLYELYTKYVGDSIKELESSGIQGKNHEYALEIHNIINSRQTDVEKNNG